MEQVGRYQIKDAIGRGAMGVVYLADDPLLNRQVAIKTVDLSVEEEDQRAFLRDRLLKDARAAAALSHTGIVSVYDVLEQGDMAYLVMEYIRGDSLAAILRAAPHPETAFTLRVLREMAAALDYTHARGIVHRDIKPANVMIDATGAAKIMDFGIARIADSRTSTPTGMVMGTVQYMAPEQVKGEHIDGKADQFALAAVAYEMLTGSTLFGQHSLATLAYKIVNEAPVPVRQQNAGVPPAVDGVISRALSKSPHDRFASCGMFASALERAFAGETAAADVPTTTMVIPRQKARRAPLLAAIAAAAVVAAGVLVWHPWSKPASAPVVQQAAIPTAPPPAVSPAPEPPPAPTTKKPVAAQKPVENADGEEEPSHPAAEALDQARKLSDSGNTVGAMQAVNRAISINPRYGMALAFRGELHQKLKQWDEASADLAQAERFMPRHALTHMHRGLCLVELNNDGEALQEFDKALELRQDLPVAYNQRGLIYLRRKDYSKAIADFTASIKINPNAPMPYQFRANARRASGDPSGAREDMQKFRSLK